MHTTIVRAIASAFALFLFNGATLIHAQGISVGGKFGVNFATTGGAQTICQLHLSSTSKNGLPWRP